MLRAAVVAALATACMTYSVALAHEPAGKPPSGAVRLSPAATQAAQVVDSFHAALAKGDTKAALTFLADDALIFERGAVERSKIEYASHHLAADAAYSQSVPSTMTRRTGAALGDMAWIASEGRAPGRYKDKAVDQKTTETMMLQRVGSAWRISHIHWSSASVKPWGGR